MGFNRRVFRPGMMSLLAAAITLPASLNRMGYGPRYTSPKGYRSINRLNRSQHWRQFDTYDQCRAYAIACGYTNRPLV